MEDHPGTKFEDTKTTTQPAEVPSGEFCPLDKTLDALIAEVRAEIVNDQKELTTLTTKIKQNGFATQVRHILEFYTQKELDQYKRYEELRKKLSHNLLKGKSIRILKGLVCSSSEKRGTLDWEKTENKKYLVDELSRCISTKDGVMVIDVVMVFSLAAHLKKLIPTATEYETHVILIYIKRVLTAIVDEGKGNFSTHDQKLHKSAVTPSIFRFYTEEEFRRYKAMRKLERDFQRTQVMSTVAEKLQSTLEKAGDVDIDKGVTISKFWHFQIKAAISECIIPAQDEKMIIDEAKLATLTASFKTLFI